MLNNTPNPNDYEWDFEKIDDVGVWYLEGWDGWNDEQLESITEHYRQRGSKQDIKATIAVFGDKTNLPKETQEYMGEEWSKNGEYVNVNKIAFVSEGITAMAVNSKMDIDGTRTKRFKKLEEAVKWCKEE